MEQNEKQAIEKMARIIGAAIEFDELDFGMEEKTEIIATKAAEKFYAEGYRKQEWISVEKRLPENDYGNHWKERQHYLVMTEPSGLMRVARFGSKEFPWWIDSHDTVMTSANYAKVTHWMPLPEAPKGGAE